MLRVVVEGMNAYYNRDAQVLRQLLERLEGARIGQPRNVQVLEQIVNTWVRQTCQEAPDE